MEIPALKYFWQLLEKHQSYTQLETAPDNILGSHKGVIYLLYKIQNSSHESSQIYRSIFQDK